MEPKNPLDKNWQEKIEVKIEDSAMQIMQFKFFTGIDQIKKLIAGTQLKTLEGYTNKTTAELNKVKPGICEAYNALIIESKNPSLTGDRFMEILEEIYKITRTS